MLCNTGIGLTGNDLSSPMISWQGKQTINQYMALTDTKKIESPQI